MTKIAIISQAEQGVLIDISGCSSLGEAKQYLTSTLQVSSQFWDGLIVDLNLGPLVLTPEQVSEIQAIVSEVGVQPRQIYSLSPITRASLIQCYMPVSGSDLANQAGECAEAAETFAEFMQPRVIRQSEQARSNALALEAAGASGGTTATVQLAEADITFGGNHTITNLAITEALPGLTVMSPGAEQPSCTETTSPAPAGQYTEAGFAVNSILPASKILQSRLSAAGLDLPKPAAAASTAKPAAKDTKPAALASGATGQMNFPRPASPAVLLMKQTLRSGQHVSHKGHLVIIGDVNPGAEIVADGDITIWGALRGMAHAGAGGNTDAEIRALKFEPLQLRIANTIARSPDRSKGPISSSGPETARIVEGKIRISASDPE